MTQAQTNRTVVNDLTALLASGATGYILVLGVEQLLTRVGLPLSLARWLATMTSGGNTVGDLGVPTGPAQAIEMQHASAWFALYLYAAAERLVAVLPPPDGSGLPSSDDTDAIRVAMEAEQRYYTLHLKAEERRQRAAALVDMASLLNGDRENVPRARLLSWNAIIDNRTTPECLGANGKNFAADKMPLIGWPGSVHVGCRCTPGPERPGAPLLPSV